MDKQKFVNFIEKYNLDGLVNSAILSFKDKKLSTRFTSGDKSLLGIISMDKWDFEDGEFGVYDTTQLKSLLKVLDSDVQMKVNKAGDKAVSIQMSDSVSKIQYILSDTAVINKPPAPENLPQDFDLKIEVNTQFIKKFIVGKDALAETDTFTITTNGGNTSVIIGYSSVNTNRVTIPVSTSEYKDMEIISFNANNFKNILKANQECESAVLEVSPQGVARITFNIDDYKSTYYLVAVQDVD
tara:strand:- start:3339 stop:4061 length:723 start_codon:yes stop_codon:yes gene_type:complete